MQAWRVPALLLPPDVDRVFPRGVGSAAYRACAAPVRAAPLPRPHSHLRTWATTAAANPASAPRRIAPRARPLRRAFLRAPCQSKSPPGRAPWILHRAPRTPLPCTWRPPPLRRGSPPAVPACARFPSCRLQWVQSSGYSSEGSLRQVRVEVSVGGRGCAARLPLLFSPRSGPRCTYRAPRRFPEASTRQTREAVRALLSVTLRSSRSPCLAPTSRS